ncbi:MAG: hypothetical protein JWN76_3246 [Chitinophagaceae bacterium]|nr:hypothetical protein [Chitinophagaceae bacterium]
MGFHYLVENETHHFPLNKKNNGVDCATCAEGIII